MLSMIRGKKVVVLAHCLLNVNAKVGGIARYTGVFEPLILSLIRNGFGIIQLPCPELGYFGVRRWGLVTEQMDIPAYRRHCRIILRPIIDQILDYHHNGYIIAGVIGVDKSPSCGVHVTCRSSLYRGEISSIPDVDAIKASVEIVDGQGVFIEEFSRLLLDNGLEISFVAIDEESLASSHDISQLLFSEDEKNE